MKSLCFIFSICFLIVACPQEKVIDKQVSFVKGSALPEKVYYLGINPLYSPEKLTELFDPLVNYLSANIPGSKFKLESPRNYQGFEEKIKKREIHFALPNPYQTLVAIKYGYVVIAKRGDDANFKGIILVRKDSNIKKIENLKGKIISYPSPTALAATMLPQYYLYKNGIKVMTQTKNLYTSSQASSIMSVYLKKSDAGASWPPSWNDFLKINPAEAKELEVKWETETLPDGALIARDDVPKDIVEKVSTLFINLNKTNEGKTILKNIEISKFELATEKTYDSVKEFVKRFSEEVRLPEDAR